MSTFHNCARWRCPLARSRPILQERQETSLQALEVQHQGDLSDLLLNVASLRSAALIQQLRNPPLTSSNIRGLTRAAVQKWQTQEEQARQEKEMKSNKKARSSGEKSTQKKRKIQELEELADM